MVTIRPLRAPRGTIVAASRIIFRAESDGNGPGAQNSTKNVQNDENSKSKIKLKIIWKMLYQLDQAVEKYLPWVYTEYMYSAQHPPVHHADPPRP